MITNRDALVRSPAHDDACRALAAGIGAAHPGRVIEEAVTLEDDTLRIGDRTYDLRDYEQILVLGGGNAAGTAAEALEAVLGDRLDGGLVVTDDPAETDRIEVVEGTHPLPSETNVEGTERLRDRARGVGAETLALVVVTGGGSALLAHPTEGVDLGAYRELTDALITSGATIDEINAVRKHLSGIKGGRLAAELAPATTVGLLFSDVVGNREDVIASGPITPDETTYTDAHGVIDRYDLDPSEAIENVLEEGERGERAETPGPDDSVFERVETHILADNQTALDAAAASLREDGYQAVILAADIEGEAQDVGGVNAAIANRCGSEGEPFEPPVALLSGGELTVTVEGDGAGGPNQEFALAAALDLEGGVVAAVDTDGIDGSTDVAGAILDPEVIENERDALAALDANDVYPYLDELGALVETGQTGTNVNDLRLLLVGGPE
ncbi:glycerate kinase type-2 family protein [Halovenus sp. HT40]|uniref:glycerate kinase type-2 family protein n=1 Tax=Halovenus sp. HT40 TaxID=3126691 RepID=UPI00300F5B16